MKFAAVALCLGFAANATAILSGRAVETSDDVEEVNPETLELKKRNLEHTKAQAFEDARLRKQAQLRKQHELEVRQTAATNAKLSKTAERQMEQRASAAANAKLQANQQAVHQLEVERLRKDFLDAKEREDKKKALLRRRAGHIWDGKKSHLSEKEEMLRQKRLEKATRNEKYERMKAKKMAELRHQESRANREKAATNLQVVKSETSVARAPSGSIRVSVIDEQERGVQLTVPSKAHAQVLMSAAAGRMGLDLTKTSFLFHGAPLKAEATMTENGLEDFDAVDVVAH